MRLIAFYGEDTVHVGRVDGDVAVVGGGPLDPDGRLGRDFEEAIGWQAGAPAQRYRLDRLDPAPIVIAPTKIVGVGLNYRDHAAEGGRAAPTRPLLFAMFANAIVGDGDPVVRPEGTHALDLEVELGVVIARTTRRVTREAALDHVAGYIVVNDITARDWQGNPAGVARRREGRWPVAAGQGVGHVPADRRAPDTPDEVDPAAGLRLRSWRIDGDGVEHLMQDGTTADMIHDVPALVAYISSVITLELGDVIATGTPAGVGVFRDPPVFLEPGDLARCEIEGIDTIDNPIIDWRDAPSGRVGSADAGPRQDRGCPGPGVGRRPDANGRDQRRPRSGAQDRHLRHGPAHRELGCLGPGRHQAAADDRPRVRRRDRGRRGQRDRLRAG